MPYSIAVMELTMAPSAAPVVAAQAASPPSCDMRAPTEFDGRSKG